MTLQQAFGRCVPAIMAGDAERIINDAAHVARDYLREAGEGWDIADKPELVKDIQGLPVYRQAIIFAMLHILKL